MLVFVWVTVAPCFFGFLVGGPIGFFSLASLSLIDLAHDGHISIISDRGGYIR